MTTEELFIEFMHHVASHMEFKDVLDAAGQPLFTRIIIHLEGDKSELIVFDGKSYVPGTDFFMDVVSAVKIMVSNEEHAAKQKKRNKGAPSVKGNVG